MKPLITYVGNASDTTIRVGKYSKSFKLGQSKRVSVAVALSVRKMRGPDGSPLFSIKDLPKIIV